MEKNFMNKMDDMEMDKVAGGARGNRGNDVKKGSENSSHGFNDKPTPKPAPTAPPKPTIDPEEVKRQQREDMKKLNNGFGIPNFDKDFH